MTVDLTTHVQPLIIWGRFASKFVPLKNITLDTGFLVGNITFFQNFEKYHLGAGGTNGIFQNFEKT